MEFLFITKYLSGDIAGIVKELHVVLIAVVAVFIAMSIDLFFGIRKAKLNGIARSSYGFRRSVIKFIEYYAAFIIAFMLDVISSISESVNLPYITFIVAAFLIFIEAKSIRENILDQDRMKDQNKDIRMLVSLFKNRGDMLKSILEVLEKQLTKEKEDNEDGKG